MMDMELENIVANTVYIKAREGEHKRKGKSKKWKEMMRFAPLAHCQDVPIDKQYNYVVERQPLGRRLFEDYCREQLHYKNWIEFLEMVNQYELSITDKKQIAEQIRKEFLAPDALRRISDCVNSSEVETCLNTLDTTFDELEHEASSKNVNFDDPRDAIFKPIQSSIKDRLALDPFSDFLDSPNFKRFQQWKDLERRQVTKSNFRQYRVLGKGGFGEVCACQVRATGKLYACKRLEKKRIKKRRGESMALNEKCILESINSRFVVTLGYAYETKEALHLVLTIMNGGDLKFHIHNLPDTMTLQRATYYAAQIACGLEDLHAEGIVYRDLKPENCLLDDNGNIRISDLGLATRIEEKKIKGRVGTVGYMAPEVVKNQQYGFGVDWWGLGCIIFELIAGRGPFRKRGEKVKREEVDGRVKNDAEKYGDEFTVEYGREQARKVAKAKEPNGTTGSNNHATGGAGGAGGGGTKLMRLKPFNVADEENGRLNGKDLCQKLLQKDPTKRLGVKDGFYSNAKEVQAHPFFQTISIKHLKAGHYYPPFQPDQKAVYAKDVLDIEQFSTVKGVTLGESDENFYRKFNTGCVSITWQNEILETVYEELNKIPIESGAENQFDQMGGGGGGVTRSFFRFAFDCFSSGSRQPTTTTTETITATTTTTS